MIRIKVYPIATSKPVFRGDYRVGVSEFSHNACKSEIRLKCEETLRRARIIGLAILVEHIPGTSSREKACSPGTLSAKPDR
jgi:hypothetical protein